jgi:non-ribosomal peptide synthetase-like protein
VVNGLHETAGVASTALLLGTPFLAPYLRGLGCTIGKWAFIDTTLFSEFDLVSIGDRACLNLGSTIQTHLFEDRVMKSAELTIGPGCSIGTLSVVLYDTRLEARSRLAPLSLVMKGERLPAGTCWHGIPAQARADWT